MRTTPVIVLSVLMGMAGSTAIADEVKTVNSIRGRSGFTSVMVNTQPKATVALSKQGQGVGTARAEAPAQRVRWHNASRPMTAAHDTTNND